MKWIVIVALLAGLNANSQSAFDKKINEAASRLQCQQPDERNPVSVSATIVAEGDSIAVIVKTKLAAGWHIYDFVPANLPYIPIDHVLKIPEGIRGVGEWIKSSSFGSADDPGVLIFEDEARFIHKLVKTPSLKPNSIIETGLYYQTCDLRQCLPPTEKLIQLKISSGN